MLSARMLGDVQNVNSYRTLEDGLQFTEGDAPPVYVMLVDSNFDTAAEGFSPAGRRYMPASGATLQVTLDSIDDDKKLVRSAVQPFAQDPSIWEVQLLTTDKVPAGTITLRLKLTEGSKVTVGSARAALRVSSARG